MQLNLRQLILKLKFNNQKGMGLIEVIAALGIATMITTSLVALSIFTLRSSLKSKLLLEGSKLANREVELIRAYRDKNSWSTFVATMDGCTTSVVPPEPVCNMSISATGVNDGLEPPLEGLPIDQVSRGFYVVKTGSTLDETVIEVTVVAQWKEGNELKSTTLRTDLTNWQGK